MLITSNKKGTENQLKPQNFLVLGSIGGAAGGEEAAENAVRRFPQALKRMGCRRLTTRSTKEVA
jgi:hypothetical protein